MKRLHVLFLGLLVVLLLLVSAVSAGTDEVWGAMETGDHHSAGVAKGFACGVGPAGVALKSHATVSDSGNETLICQGRLPTGTEPSQAVIVKGEVCGLYFGGLTTNMQAVITPGGLVNLRCQTP